MRNLIHLVLLAGMGICIACSGDTTSTSSVADTPPPLPNTPTQVAQEWVEAFYSDNFDKAVLLGTDNTRRMIDSVQLEMIPGAANIAFTIRDMNCETKGDSSYCVYIYEEEQEEFQEFVQLLRVDGQWLVDESWEELSPEELEMEELIREELERIFEERESK